MANSAQISLNFSNKMRVLPVRAPPPRPPPLNRIGSGIVLFGHAAENVAINLRLQLLLDEAALWAHRQRQTSARRVARDDRPLESPAALYGRPC